MIKSAEGPTAIICVDNQAVNGKHNEMLIFLGSGCAYLNKFVFRWNHCHS
jgi:hypothetical protein